MRDLSDIRREYLQGGLRRNDLPDNPIQQFETWIDQAKGAELADPTAFSLGTVDERGCPFQRIVLLKQFDERGFVFYTNLGSRKAKQIEHNPLVSMLFPWHEFERQVHITGRAERLSTAEVMRYFVSRPRDSQIGAWASPQSSTLSARSVLEGSFMKMKEKFAKGEVPLPDFWGGYRIIPDTIEFWQGGSRRLHDRFLYQRQQDGWSIERLAP
ncbi:pyridoxamine 5'-phosphate oxidase [Ferrimonas marina]|uniref:Pyridoxine/pyridoxamine 5'-phosphate oxidase n=1 Tax=Ferrimonas marina TaxID=299255 RepID=A0A1M5Z451_9GAMM|nr:pyridoxamine 5'-phosphate oxidase [Ferrimonas marina]SHI19042.1 Pyridoxamine 5'-phosphate oxidase [Ferrimonas marina]